MESKFLELPGELRNIIYEYAFDIQYDLVDDPKSLRWSIPPRRLMDLFLVCKQIYRESSSLFYLEVFPSFEFRAVSFIHLHRFTVTVPPQHRDKFKATVTLLLLNGLEVLRRVGLGADLPWDGSRHMTEISEPVLQVERRLRGDCFNLVYFSKFGGPAGFRHDYDRIKMVGHLGRLQWTSETPPRIIFRAPISKDEPPPSSQLSFGLV